MSVEVGAKTRSEDARTRRHEDVKVQMVQRREDVIFRAKLRRRQRHTAGTHGINGVTYSVNGFHGINSVTYILTASTA